MYLTIGSAARAAGLSPTSLRLYERLGLLAPARDSAGRRVYVAADVQLARAVAAQRAQGRTRGLQTFRGGSGHG